jgi:hypothetical protein
METYDEALQWIQERAKEYGGMNKFLSSCEYQQKYPEIEKLHKKAMDSYKSKAHDAMCSVNINAGDKVFYDVVGTWGHVEQQEGTVYIDTKGMPKVKLTSGKSVKWHKGFKPIIKQK